MTDIKEETWREEYKDTLEAMWLEHASTSYTNSNSKTVQNWWCKHCQVNKYRLCACAKKRFMERMYIGRVETYIKEQKDGSWRKRNAQLLVKIVESNLQKRVRQSRTCKECKEYDSATCVCAEKQIASKLIVDEYKEDVKDSIYLCWLARNVAQNRVKRTRYCNQCKGSDKELCKCVLSKLADEITWEEFHQFQKKVATSDYDLF